MGNRISKDGKGLEKLVTLIYQTLKDNPLAEVLHNQKLANSYGRKSQFDVIIKVKIASYDNIIAIECKDYGSTHKIDVSEIHDFEGKCKFVSGISRKIFVAVNGYQAGAKSVAKNYGIDLYDLNEISPELLSGWVVTKSIKISRPSEIRIGKIKFFTKDGRKILYNKDDINKDFYLYELTGSPVQFMHAASQVIKTAFEQKEIYNTIMKSIDGQWSKIKLDNFENEIILTASIGFSLGNKRFGAILENKLQELEMVGIDIDYAYEVITPHGVVSRLYSRDTENMAETVSGSILNGELKFEMVHHTKDKKTSVYIADSSGRVVEFWED